MSDLSKLTELSSKAAQVRKLIVESVHHANAGHIGGPMSATDILVALYFDSMNIRPDQPDWEGRDRFVLSKGHSAIGLYSVLAVKGYLPVEELKTFDAIDSRLQAHPDMNVLPGLDMSTGSLGQGISAAVGMALGAKLKNESFYTYCMLGDGESQEGQVWEAADIASRYGLDNLIVILDYNKLQQYGWNGADGARDLPVHAPQERWNAFGWNVITIDGHDMEEILSAVKQAKQNKGTPTVIVAHTVKGKGVSFMENNYLWHSKVPTSEELQKALQEIGKGA
ncbi:transketolase [Brevibacillus sp. NRS-1366]|uniref:transketolase n=1 Tax=Brevibacillus sp. NRS-1366 TaxID=3233899 RepID=UPI003D19C1DE